MVEDCQQQRPIVTLRMAFMITGTGVHDRPEWPFTINWIGCSRSNGIGVHDRPERARLAEILDEMEAVGGLSGLGSARAGGYRIQATPVAADNFNGGMLGQPRRCARGASILQKIRHGPPLQVHNDRAVVLSFSPSPVINANRPQRRCRRPFFGPPLPSTVLPGALQRCGRLAGPVR